jgi:MoaA/NifB/PqqE/SkfB family radical SAM enzyme
MTKLSPLDIGRLLHRGVHNYVTQRPLAISLEVTLSCNCNCRHCDLGGIVQNEKRLTPREYAELIHHFSPPIVQLSGGEPLLRTDIVDIVKAIKRGNGTPYLILVTNGVLLDEAIYDKLHDAGVNQISISVDFPDDRMDDFRRHKGLFNHLTDIVPVLARKGNGDILLNTAITLANLDELLLIADKAQEWGVSVSYSAYTKLRTGNLDYLITDNTTLDLLRKNIHELIERKKTSKSIANSDRVLLSTIDYFKQGYMPNCQAGRRFFVIMPDGSLVPCSLQRYKFDDQQAMIKEFTESNNCGSCWVSMRSYTDRSLFSLLKDCPTYANRLLMLRRGYRKA